MRYRLSCDPSFSFDEKASFDPLIALARLPRHGTFVAKFGLTPAVDVVATKGQLDDRMTFRASLPAVLLHEGANDGRVIVWFAELPFRMRSLATMGACHCLAGGACNATAERLSGAKER